jgi:aldose 1-epimerase
MDHSFVGEALTSPSSSPQALWRVLALETKNSGAFRERANRSYTQPMHFGRMPDGTLVELHTWRSAELEICVTNFGGRIVALKMLDPQGGVTPIVLGFNSLDDYIADNQYLGALVGRYANRIAHGHFKLGAQSYTLSKNNGAHSLHGGRHGFDQRLWRASKHLGSLTLTYTSRDGEEGYPGSLDSAVRYSLAGNELQIDFEAQATADTPVNLTSHAYFNLSGNPQETILGHQVQIYAQRFTPVTSALIPTGELRSVIDTPFDFLRSHSIGERIGADDQQLLFGHGYDHNWVLDNQSGSLSLAATVYEPTSGRVMEVLTTEPGIQFYTGNQLGGDSGVPSLPSRHARRCGFCLETQHFPDSPNHPHFPSTTLLAGQVYRSQTVYRFSVKR